MRSRSHQGKYSLILLFVGIFAFWWGIAVLSQTDKSAYPASQASASPVSTSSYVPQAVAGTVAVQTSFASGTYTYSGSVPLALSCDELGTGISVTGTNPEHVTIILTIQRPVGCKDRDTAVSQPFAASLSVPPNTKAVLDGLTVNGVIVQTSLSATKK